MVYVAILAAMVLLRLILREDTTKNRRTYSLICFLLLFIFAALRAPSVGRDTALFIDIFEKVSERGFFDVLRFSSWTEPGFRLFCALIGVFTENSQWLVVISSLVIHGSVSIFLYRHVKNPYLGFFLYITTMLYPFFFSMMRQGMALAIWLFAYGFLKKKKWIPYCLITLLAATFHTSALLFLICPFFTLFKVTRKRLRFILPIAGAATAIGAVFARPLIRFAQRIFPRYADYEPTTFDALYLYFAVFFVIAAFGIVVFYYRGEEEHLTTAFDEKSFLTLMMLLGLVVAATMTQFGQLQRLFNYFEFFYLLWLPACLPAAYVVEDRGQHRLAFPLVTLVVSSAMIVYFTIILFTRSALWYDALPYLFFWQ